MAQFDRTYGCNTNTTQDGFSCPIPDVSPADWFAVIIAAFLLVAALVRWSSKLIVADPVAVGPARVANAAAADNYLISGGNAYMDYLGSPLPPPPAPLAASFDELVGSVDRPSSYGGSLSQYQSASAIKKQTSGAMVYKYE